MSDVIVGVDLGGTKIAAAQVDATGTLGDVVTVPTRATAGPAAVLDAVAAAVASASAGATLLGVGIGTAGAVDASRGVIVSATDTFPNWVGTDIPQGLHARLGPDVEIRVHNDVDAHLLGEAWLGAARGRSNVLMIAPGTGIGGALLVEGALVTGAHHLAGEVGHIPTPGAEGLRCGCGRDGHLEALAAGPAILRRYQALGGDPTLADTRQVVSRVTTDPLAHRCVAEAATGLGRSIAGLATCLDPEIVLIGGGLGQADGLWWDTLVSTIHAEVVEALAGLPVVRGMLGPSAAILGAARPLFATL